MQFCRRERQRKSAIVIDRRGAMSNRRTQQVLFEAIAALGVPADKADNLRLGCGFQPHNGRSRKSGGRRQCQHAMTNNIKIKIHGIELELAPARAGGA